MTKLKSINRFILFFSCLFVLLNCSVITKVNSINDGVTRINLSHQSLTEIPKEIFEIKNLKVLILNHNKIKEIPPEIGKLINLEKLILSHNQIVNVPEEIGYLVRLKKLSLKANNIESIPYSIGELESLEILRLSFNKITNLPDEICNLKNISQLYLSYNKLEFLPDSIGKLPLKDLYLNQNQLKTVPQSFYELHHLNRLNVSNAGPFFNLDNQICKMWRIETLYIDKNSLNFMPRCLEIRARSNSRFDIILE